MTARDERKAETFFSISHIKTNSSVRGDGVGGGTEENVGNERGCVHGVQQVEQERELYGRL